MLGAFFLQDLAYADPDLLKPIDWTGREDRTRWAEKILPSIPHSTALLEDAWKSNGGTRLIYLLQDAHTNNSGQLNLSKTLDRLFQHDPALKTIYLEAGSGDESLSFLRPYAPLSRREQVARKYLQRGELQGTEYLDLTSDQELILWGVEDMGLYARALELYRRTARERERFDDFLSRVEATILGLKPRVLNPVLLSFDREAEKYRDEKRSLTDYYAFLFHQAERLRIDLSAFPHLKSFQKLQASESGIDFQAANREQAAAIASMSDEDRQELAEASKEPYAALKISSAQNREKRAYFTLLGEKLAGRMTEYPELAKYLNYLTLALETAPRELLKEQTSFEQAIYKALTMNRDEEDLLKASRNTRFLKKLLHLQITPDEYDDYRKAEKDFDIHQLTGFLNRKIMELRTLYEDFVFLEEGYEDVVRQCEEFYRLTFERDRAFLRNLEEKMERQGEDRAVLVTGGFHTPNLKHLFQKENISYIILTPQIFHETDQSRYEKLLLSQKIALPTSYPQVARPSHALMIGRLRNDALNNRDRIVGELTNIPWRDLVAPPKGSRLASELAPHEKMQMIEAMGQIMDAGILRGNLIPELKRLAENDGSEVVRAHAAQMLEILNRRLEIIGGARLSENAPAADAADGAGASAGPVIRWMDRAVYFGLSRIRFFSIMFFFDLAVGTAFLDIMTNHPFSRDYELLGNILLKALYQNFGIALAGSALFAASAYGLKHLLVKQGYWGKLEARFTAENNQKNGTETGEPPPVDSQPVSETADGARLAKADEFLAQADALKRLKVKLVRDFGMKMLVQHSPELEWLVNELFRRAKDRAELLAIVRQNPNRLFDPFYKTFEAALSDLDAYFFNPAVSEVFERPFGGFLDPEFRTQLQGYMERKLGSEMREIGGMTLGEALPLVVRLAESETRNRVEVRMRSRIVDLFISLREWVELRLEKATGSSNESVFPLADLFIVRDRMNRAETFDRYLSDITHDAAGARLSVAGSMEHVRGIYDEYLLRKTPAEAGLSEEELKVLMGHRDQLEEAFRKFSHKGDPAYLDYEKLLDLVDTIYPTVQIMDETTTMTSPGVTLLVPALERLREAILDDIGNAPGNPKGARLALVPKTPLARIRPQGFARLVDDLRLAGIDEMENFVTHKDIYRWWTNKYLLYLKKIGPSDLDEMEQADGKFAQGIRYYVETAQHELEVARKLRQSGRRGEIERVLKKGLKFAEALDRLHETDKRAVDLRLALYDAVLLLSGSSTRAYESAKIPSVPAIQAAPDQIAVILMGLLLPIVDSDFRVAASVEYPEGDEEGYVVLVFSADETAEPAKEELPINPDLSQALSRRLQGEVSVLEKGMGFELRIPFVRSQLAEEYRKLLASDKRSSGAVDWTSLQDETYWLGRENGAADDLDFASFTEKTARDSESGDVAGEKASRFAQMSRRGREAVERYLKTSQGLDPSIRERIEKNPFYMGLLLLCELEDRPLGAETANLARFEEAALETRKAEQWMREREYMKARGFLERAKEIYGLLWASRNPLPHDSILRSEVAQNLALVDMRLAELEMLDKRSEDLVEVYRWDEPSGQAVKTDQKAEYFEALQNGYTTASVLLYGFDPAGRLILQERGSFFGLAFPNTLGPTVAGRARSGETDVRQIIGRLSKEELGIDIPADSTRLVKVGSREDRPFDQRAFYEMIEYVALNRDEWSALSKYKTEITARQRGREADPFKRLHVVEQPGFRRMFFYVVDPEMQHLILEAQNLLAADPHVPPASSRKVHRVTRSVWTYHFTPEEMKDVRQSQNALTAHSGKMVRSLKQILVSDFVKSLYAEPEKYAIDAFMPSFTDNALRATLLGEKTGPPAAKPPARAETMTPKPLSDFETYEKIMEDLRLSVREMLGYHRQLQGLLGGIIRRVGHREGQQSLFESLRERLREDRLYQEESLSDLLDALAGELPIVPSDFAQGGRFDNFKDRILAFADDVSPAYRRSDLAEPMNSLKGHLRYLARSIESVARRVLEGTIQESIRTASRKFQDPLWSDFDWSRADELKKDRKPRLSRMSLVTEVPRRDTGEWFVVKIGIPDETARKDNGAKLLKRELETLKYIYEKTRSASNGRPESIVPAVSYAQVSPELAAFLKERYPDLNLSWLSEGQAAIVSRRIDGLTPPEYMERRLTDPALKPEAGDLHLAAVDYALGVIRSMLALHQKAGFLHQDFGPSEIKRDAGGRYYLFDFGNAFKYAGEDAAERTDLSLERLRELASFSLKPIYQDFNDESLMISLGVQSAAMGYADYQDKNYEQLLDLAGVHYVLTSLGRALPDPSEESPHVEVLQGAKEALLSSGLASLSQLFKKKEPANPQLSVRYLSDLAASLESQKAKLISAGARLAAEREAAPKWMRRAVERGVPVKTVTYELREIRSFLHGLNQELDPEQRLEPKDFTDQVINQYGAAAEHLNGLLDLDSMTRDRLEKEFLGMHGILGGGGLIPNAGRIVKDNDLLEARRIVRRLFSRATAVRMEWDPVSVAARVFVDLVNLQAFQDGNKRAASLLMNYVLRKAGYEPFILTVDNAVEYQELVYPIREDENVSFKKFSAFLDREVRRTGARLSDADVYRGHIRDLVLYGTSGLASEPMPEDMASHQLGLFEEALKELSEMKGAFDAAHLRNLRNNLAGAENSFLDLSDGSFLLTADLPARREGDTGFHLFRWIGRNEDDDFMVGYNIYSAEGVNAAGRRANAVHVAFDLFKPYRAHQHPRAKPKASELFEISLGLLQRRFQPQRFVVPVKSQITSSRVGDRTQNAVFYLKRGFYPESAKEEADALLLKANRGETITTAEIDGLLARSHDDFWTLPMNQGARLADETGEGQEITPALWRGLDLRDRELVLKRLKKKSDFTDGDRAVLVDALRDNIRWIHEAAAELLVRRADEDIVRTLTDAFKTASSERNRHFASRIIDILRRIPFADGEAVREAFLLAAWSPFATVARKGLIGLVEKYADHKETLEALKDAEKSRFETVRLTAAEALRKRDGARLAEKEPSARQVQEALERAFRARKIDVRLTPELVANVLPLFRTFKGLDNVAQHIARVLARRLRQQKKTPGADPAADTAEFRNFLTEGPQGARMAYKEEMAEFGIRIYRKGIFKRTDAADFSSVPESADWVMDAPRMPETKRVLKTLKDMPVVASPFDLGELFVLKQNAAGESESLLGLVETDRGTRPARIRLFRASSTDAQKLDELIKVQVYDRLGVLPHFYGVVKNDRGEILGYATQLVIGEEIGYPKLEPGYLDAFTMIINRTMGRDLPVPVNFVKTRKGSLAAVEVPPSVPKKALNAFIEKNNWESSLSAEIAKPALHLSDEDSVDLGAKPDPDEDDSRVDLGGRPDGARLAERPLLPLTELALNAYLEVIRRKGDTFETARDAFDRIFERLHEYPAGQALKFLRALNKMFADGRIPFRYGQGIEVALDFNLYTREGDRRNPLLEAPIEEELNTLRSYFDSLMEDLFSNILIERVIYIVLDVVPSVENGKKPVASRAALSDLITYLADQDHPGGSSKIPEIQIENIGQIYREFYGTPPDREKAEDMIRTAIRLIDGDGLDPRSHGPQDPEGARLAVSEAQTLISDFERIVERRIPAEKTWVGLSVSGALGGVSGFFGTFAFVGGIGWPGLAAVAGSALLAGLHWIFFEMSEVRWIYKAIADMRTLELRKFKTAREDLEPLQASNDPAIRNLAATGIFLADALIKGDLPSHFSGFGSGARLAQRDEVRVKPVFREGANVIPSATDEEIFKRRLGEFQELFHALRASYPDPEFQKHLNNEESLLHWVYAQTGQRFEQEDFYAWPVRESEGGDRSFEHYVKAALAKSGLKSSAAQKVETDIQNLIAENKSALELLTLELVAAVPDVNLQKPFALELSGEAPPATFRIEASAKDKEVSLRLLGFEEPVVVLKGSLKAKLRSYRKAAEAGKEPSVTTQALKTMMQLSAMKADLALDSFFRDRVAAAHEIPLQSFASESAPGSFEAQAHYLIYQIVRVRKSPAYEKDLFYLTGVSGANKALLEKIIEEAGTDFIRTGPVDPKFDGIRLQYVETDDLKAAPRGDNRTLYLPVSGLAEDALPAWYEILKIGGSLAGVFGGAYLPDGRLIHYEKVGAENVPQAVFDFYNQKARQKMADRSVFLSLLIRDDKNPEDFKRRLIEYSFHLPLARKIPIQILIQGARLAMKAVGSAA